MEREAFLKMVRCARQHGQTITVKLRRKPAHRDTPAGVRNLYALHDKGFIQINPHDVSKIWRAYVTPILWKEDEYRTIEVGFSSHPQLESRQISLELLWCGVGRYLLGIHSSIPSSSSYQPVRRSAESVALVVH